MCHCMPSKCYEVTVCQLWRSIPSFRHLSWPSWLIVPLHGTVSAQPKTEISWSRSCEGVSAVATAWTILQPLKNYVLPLMPSCFSELLLTLSTHYTYYLLYLLLPMTSDRVLTISHCQINIVLSTIVTLSLGCCMPIVIDIVIVIRYFILLSCLQLQFVICITNEELNWVSS